MLPNASQQPIADHLHMAFVHRPKASVPAPTNTNEYVNGFSLTELVVAIFIASVTFFGASQLLIGHINSAARQESILRLQESWNRAQFLIDQDMDEGAGACFTNADTMTIFNVQGSNSNITYSVDESKSLLRTGPSINQNGSLDLSTPSGPIQVIQGVDIFSAINNPDPCNSSNASKKLEYNLSLSESRNGRILSRYSNQGRPGGGYSRIAPIN